MTWISSDNWDDDQMLEALTRSIITVLAMMEDEELRVELVGGLVTAIQVQTGFMSTTNDEHATRH